MQPQVLGQFGVERDAHRMALSHAHGFVPAAHDHLDAGSNATNARRPNEHAMQRATEPRRLEHIGKRIDLAPVGIAFDGGVAVSGEPLTTLWDDVLSNNLHQEGGIEFPKGKKPEGLVKRCFELATKAGDIVMDTFAGSGTSPAR